jgi:plastocyanin
MEQTMTRTLALFAFVACIGCGSDKYDAADSGTATEYDDHSSHTTPGTTPGATTGGTTNAEVLDAATVVTSGTAFAPGMVTLSVGGTVTFELASAHNVLEVDQGSWDANEANALDGGFSVDFGETADIVFNEPGLYYFVCQPHAGMGMKGMIEVVE